MHPNIRLYCGYEDAIEAFDISRPGEGTRIPTTPSRKSKDGLKGALTPSCSCFVSNLPFCLLPGIVSALAFSPIYTTSSDTFYAAGTLSSTSSNLALYSESQGDIPLMFLGGGLRSGVTQVRPLLIDLLSVMNIEQGPVQPNTPTYPICRLPPT